jgi:crotonobetainyl-CoA:carnitine CoA-transferase CaiB-like acyl-CoA transferase
MIDQPTLVEVTDKFAHLKFTLQRLDPPDLLIRVRAGSEDQRFATAGARLEHREALDAAIGGWTATFQPGALEELLQSVGVPAHRLSDCSDILDDPQLKARDHIVYLDHPRFGSVPYESSSRTKEPAGSSRCWCSCRR